jgi:hypothetical protein
VGREEKLSMRLAARVQDKIIIYLLIINPLKVSQISNFIRGFLSCCAVQRGGWIEVFRRTVLPLSLG